MISKKIFFLLGLVVLLGAGCVRPAPVTPEKPIVLTGSVPGLSERDLAEIKLNVADGGGTMADPREFDPAWKIPSAVHPGQLGQAYQWYQSVDFVLVKQRNISNPITQTSATDPFYQGPILFAGVLMTVNGGEDWHALVATPEYMLDGQLGRPNPVGFYTNATKQPTLIVDFVDDHGAGSGEGNLSRYVSKDGITWKRTACAYYVPETYQTSPYKFDLPSLKVTPCSKEIPMTLGPSK